MKAGSHLMVHKSQHGMLTPEQICRRLKKPLLLDEASKQFGRHLIQQYAKSVLWWYEYLEIQTDLILAASHSFSGRVNYKLEIINYELCNFKNKNIVASAPLSQSEINHFWLRHLYASLNWCDILNKKPDWVNKINPYAYLIMLRQLNIHFAYSEWHVVVMEPNDGYEVSVKKLTKLGTDFDESVFDMYPYEDDNSDK